MNILLAAPRALPPAATVLAVAAPSNGAANPSDVLLPLLVLVTDLRSTATGLRDDARRHRTLITILERRTRVAPPKATRRCVKQLTPIG